MAEACRILKVADSEIVINLQGDEPFIEPEIIERLKSRMGKIGADGKAPFMGSCCKIISSKEAEDTNLVKVVLDGENRAIYFSRAKIPFYRASNNQPKNGIYYGHLGIYGFSAKSLQEFCELNKSPLEEIEKLEQLRAICSGKDVAMEIVESKSFGIDTQEDLERALEIFCDKR